jgi:regulator of replication initiation timing
MKKVKVETEMNEKTLNTKISIKDKTINDLLEEKKKFTVEVKILSEKLDFAKIMEETKEKDPQKKIEPPSPRFTEDDKLEL